MAQGSKELIYPLQYCLRWCTFSRFQTGKSARVNAYQSGQGFLADPQKLTPPFDVFGGCLPGDIPYEFYDFWYMRERRGYPVGFPIIDGAFVNAQLTANVSLKEFLIQTVLSQMVSQCL